jgi:hypothetical protein
VVTSKVAQSPVMGQETGYPSCQSNGLLAVIVNVSTVEPPDVFVTTVQAASDQSTTDSSSEASKGQTIAKLLEAGGTTTPIEICPSKDWLLVKL